MMNMTETQQEHIMSTNNQTVSTKATRAELAGIAIISAALTALIFAMLPVDLAEIAMLFS